MPAIAVDSTASLARGRRPGLRPRLGAAMAVLLGALLLLVGATWVATDRLVEEGRGIARTRRVVFQVDDTLLAWKDAEAAFRVAVAGPERPEDLPPFRAAVVQLGRCLSRLATVTAEDARQTGRAPALRRLSDEAVPELKATVELLAAGRRDEALRALARVRARSALDEIRRPVEEMSVDERAFLSREESKAQASVKTLFGTLAVGATLLFGFLFVIWYLIRTDLSRRDAAEIAIRERESRIRRLVDSNLVGVVFSDADRIAEANDAFLSIIGLDRAAFTTGSFRVFDFTAPEHVALDDACAAELRAKGTCRPYQKELVRPDGTRVPVLFGATLLDPSSAWPVNASFVVDLSELKRLEAERNRLYEEARDAVEARDAFLSVAGHEIRTPLSALNLLMYQLSRRLRSTQDPKALEVLVKCEKQLTRLLRLTDELLDVSRITAGALHLDREEVDLGALAREIVDRLDEMARRAGCALTFDGPPQLAGYWDRSRLDQVLTNLLTNAVKFGAGKPVDVRLQAEGDLAVVAVKDSGIGISAEDQGRVFERFQRAVPKEAYRGLGLGLWIVQEIVEAHGGSVRLESRPGAGATFTIALPRNMGHEEPAA